MGNGSKVGQWRETVTEISTIKKSLLNFRLGKL